MGSVSTLRKINCLKILLVHVQRVHTKNPGSTRAKAKNARDAPRLRHKPAVKDLTGSPLDSLSEFTVVPLTPPEERLFDPTPEEVSRGTSIFQTDEQKIVVHKADIYPEKLKEIATPEVAFIGRSNVGKSSLIDVLLPGIPDNRTPSISSKPGHTRSIRMYELRNYFTLVDLPGYGYNAPEYFSDCIEGYLQKRRNLDRIFLLIDAEVGFTTNDRIATEMLEEFSKPYTIVMTKHDKAKPSILIRNVLQLKKDMQNLPCCFPQPFLVSSHSRAGISFLQAYIAYVTSNLTVNSI